MLGRNKFDRVREITHIAALVKCFVAIDQLLHQIILIRGLYPGNGNCRYAPKMHVFSIEQPVSTKIAGSVGDDEQSRPRASRAP